MKRTKPQHTPTHSQVRALILSLDSAKHESGSVLLEPDSLASCGFKPLHICNVTRQHEREDCVAHLYSRCLATGLPMLIVAESWRLGGMLSRATVLGMGEGWGLWRAEMYRSAEEHPELPPVAILRVVPDEWRRGLFGKTSSIDWKQDAIDYVKQQMGVTVPDDAAEAVCIGIYLSRVAAAHKEVDTWLKRFARLQKRKLARS